MAVAIYWARQSCSGEEGSRDQDWLELRDTLLAAAKDVCAVCQNEEMRIECQCCRAAYYCSLQCQKEHRELGHDEDCRKSIVYNPSDRVLITGLTSAVHLNGAVGRIKHYDEKKGRYAVTMYEQGRDILVKPDNLVVGDY
jgi:hypothetical protein